MSEYSDICFICYQWCARLWLFRQGSQLQSVTESRVCIKLAECPCQLTFKFRPSSCPITIYAQCRAWLEFVSTLQTVVIHVQTPKPHCWLGSVSACVKQERRKQLLGRPMVTSTPVKKDVSNVVLFEPCFLHWQQARPASLRLPS